MAITAMYEETIKLKDLVSAAVVLCTLPGDPPLLKYTWFRNDNYLLDLEAVLKRCQYLDYLLLHIPEYKVNRMLDWLADSQALLRNVRELHLNVLLFNIDVAQGQDVSALQRFGKVTCTTAHEAYSNQVTRDALGVTLHRLLICKGPEFYSPTGYQEKESLLIVSADEHPLREVVLSKIRKEMPGLVIRVIQGLRYEEFVDLIRRAKWSLTFGEGLDGFFVETSFSGGVAFAVFNDRFFTPPFATLENVYPSWTHLLENICHDFQRLDESDAYTRTWRLTYELLSQTHNTDRFRENLRAFYRAEYTFP